METKSKSETSLMKKTKKELIDIICRKDEVEKRLVTREKDTSDELRAIKDEVTNFKKTIDDLSQQLTQHKAGLNVAKSEIATKQKAIDKLVSERDKAEREVSQHQETIDALITEKVEYTSIIKKYKILTWCLTIALIAAVAVAIVC